MWRKIKHILCPIHFFSESLAVFKIIKQNMHTFSNLYDQQLIQITEIHFMSNLTFPPVQTSYNDIN